MKELIPENKNLISRADSSALKGFLILLIILGHIRGISNEFQMYLYCFHVQCFFILPFLYRAKPLNTQSFSNLALKLLWPFVLLYGLQILMAIFIFHDSSFTSSSELIPGIKNWVLGIWSFITGGITLIDKFCTTQFLWFLPCFFSMSLIRMWYEQHNFKPLQVFLLCLLGTGCYLLYSTFSYLNEIYPQKIFLIAQAVSPFSIWQGLGFFTIGLVTLWIIRHDKIKNRNLYLGIIVILSCVYWITFGNQIWFRILRFVFPVFFFLAIYYSRKWFSNSRWLIKLGDKSLAVYLIHPFLCIACGLIIPKTLINNVFIIALQFIIILIISYAIAVLIERIKILRMILFPKGEEIGLKNS